MGNISENDYDLDNPVYLSASGSVQESLHPSNLFQDSSQVLTFLNGNDSEFLKEVIKNIGYQINFFSIQDGANAAGLKLKCKVCNVTLCIKSIGKHALKKHHLENVQRRCIKSKDAPEAFISEENWSHLGYAESSNLYCCTLCDVTLSDSRSSWAEHFQNNDHRIKLKEAKPDIILSTVNLSSTPSYNGQESFGPNSAKSGEVYKLSAEDEGVQISKSALSDHQPTSLNKSKLSLSKDTSFKDLIGVQIEDLHYNHKKIVQQLSDKLKEKLHCFKLNYTRKKKGKGIERLCFICKVCAMHLTATEVAQHLATPHHLKGRRKNLIALPFASFNDCDKKVVTNLSNQLGSMLNFFALTFQCGSNRLCLVCYPCGIILLPPNVMSHIQSNQHLDQFNTNLFSLHLDSLNLSNKQVVRKLTAEIQGKMSHFSLVHKIGTDLLCFFCKYCQVFLQEQNLAVHVCSPQHVEAVSSKPKDVLFPDSVKIKDSNSEHVSRLVSQHQISLQEDPIGLQVKDLNEIGRVFFQELFGKLQDKIHFYKITSWNGSDVGFLSCKVCNVTIFPGELERHPETNLHLKNLPKNLCAVKLESFKDSDKKIVNSITNQLSDRIYFSSLIFECGSSKLCFLCNLCNMILKPVFVVGHFRSAQHINNFKKNLFSLDFNHMNGTNKEIVRKIKQEIKNSMETFNFVYKIGSNQLRVHCKFCGLNLSVGKIKDHILSHQLFNVVPQKLKYKISPEYASSVPEIHSLKCNASTPSIASSCSSQNLKNACPSVPRLHNFSQRDILGLRMEDLNGEGKAILNGIITRSFQNSDQIHFYKIFSWDGRFKVGLSCKICDVPLLPRYLVTHLERKSHKVNLRKHLYAVNFNSISDSDAKLVRELASKLSHRKYFFTLTFQCGSNKVCLVCNICNEVLLPKNVLEHVGTKRHLDNLDKDLFCLDLEALSDLNKGIVRKVTSKIKDKINHFNLVYLIGTDKLQFYCKYCHYALQEGTVENHALMMEHLRAVSKTCHAKIVSTDAANIKESQSIKLDSSAASIVSSSFSESSVTTSPICKVEIFPSNTEKIKKNVQLKSTISDTQYPRESRISENGTICETLLEIKQCEVRTNQEKSPPALENNTHGTKLEEFACRVCKMTIHHKSFENKGLPKHLINHVFVNCSQNSAKSILVKAKNSKLWFKGKDEMAKVEQNQGTDQFTSNHTKMCPILIQNDKNPSEPLREESLVTLLDEISSKVSRIAQIIQNEWSSLDQCAQEFKATNDSTEVVKVTLLDEISCNIVKAKDTILREMDPINWPTVKYTALNDSNKELARKLTFRIGSKMNDLELKYSSILNEICFYCKYCCVKMFLIKHAGNHVHGEEHIKYAHLNKSVVIYESLNAENKNTVRDIYQILSDRISDFDVRCATESNELSIFCKLCNVALSPQTVIEHANSNKEHLGHLRGHFRETLPVSDLSISPPTSMSNKTHTVCDINLTSLSSGLTKQTLVLSDLSNGNFAPAMVEDYSSASLEESQVQSPCHTKEKSLEPGCSNNSCAIELNEKHPVTCKENQYQSCSFVEKESVELYASNNYSAPNAVKNQAVNSVKNEPRPAGLINLKEKSAVQDNLKSKVAPKSANNVPVGCEGNEYHTLSPKDSSFAALDPRTINLAQKSNRNYVWRNRGETIASSGFSSVEAEENSDVMGVNHANEFSSQIYESLSISGSSARKLPPKNEILNVLNDKRETKLFNPVEDSSAAPFTANECSPQKLNRNGAFSLEETENQWSKGSSATSRTESALKLNENRMNNCRDHTSGFSQVSEDCQVPKIFRTSATCVSKISNPDLPNSEKEVFSEAQAFSETLLFEHPYTKIMEILMKKVGDRINELAPLKIEASKCSFKCKVCWDTIITLKNVGKHLATEQHQKYLPLLKLQNFEAMTDLGKSVIKNLFKKINYRIFHFYVTNVDELERPCFVCQFCHVAMFEDNVVKHGCFVKNSLSKRSKNSKATSSNFETVALNEITASIGNRIEEFSLKYEDSKLFFECKLCETNLPPINVKSHVNLTSHLSLRPLMKLGFETLDGLDKQIVRQTFNQINDKILNFRLIHLENSKKLWFVCKDCCVYLSPQRVKDHLCRHVTFHFYCVHCEIMLANGETLENHVSARQHSRNLWSTCPFANVIRSFKDFNSDDLSCIQSLAFEVGYSIGSFDFYRKNGFAKSELGLFCKVCEVPLLFSSAKEHLSKLQHQENLLRTCSSLISGSARIYRRDTVISEILSSLTSLNTLNVEWNTSDPYCQLCEVPIAFQTLIEHANSEEHLENLPLNDIHLSSDIIEVSEYWSSALLLQFKPLASRIGARMHCFDIRYQKFIFVYIFEGYCRVCCCTCAVQNIEEHLTTAEHAENLLATCFGHFRLSEHLRLPLPFHFSKGNNVAKQILGMTGQNASNRDGISSGWSQPSWTGSKKNGENVSNQFETYSNDVFGLKSSNMHGTMRQDPVNTSEFSSMQSSSNTSWCSLL